MLSPGVKKIDSEIEDKDRRNHNTDHQKDSGDDGQPEHYPPQAEAEVRELCLEAATVLVEIGEIWEQFLFSYESSGL